MGVAVEKEKKFRVRNSAVEFLIFTGQNGEDGIEVRVAEETIWLSQKLMESTIRNFRIVQKKTKGLASENEAFCFFYW